MPSLLSIRFLPAVLLAWALPACRDKEKPPAAIAPPPPPNLAPLGAAPDWKTLDAYQGTITQADFLRLLDTAFSQPGAWRSTISVDEQQATVRTVSALSDGPLWTLRFAPTNAAEPKRYWRAAKDLPRLGDPALPLAGVHIAIDPGHIGGHWARIEERWYQVGNAPAVKEGELTLTTARILQPMLEKLGAKVSLVRDRLEPVTAKRPADFMSAARLELAKLGLDPDHPPASPPTHTLQWQAEKLFYRTSEIRARASLVNDHLRPDLVLCLHFNAASWGNGSNPTFSTENHLHLILNGAFGLDELTLDDQRHEMLTRLLQRCFDEEFGVSDAVARTLAASTGLPPYVYSHGAIPLPGNPYLWARNLLANRLYQCPVVYCEPYVMNNQEVSDRIQAGDYEGEAEVAGKLRRSIFREYASGVADGLRQYFSQQRQ